MHLHLIDWGMIFGFFAIALIIGVVVSKQAGKSESDFFLGGRNMPWWLLGFSMVATTFSTDTPNFVTNLVRVRGVAGNWAWFAFLITGMLTVFIYARLWRRSNAVTDVEFYEIRYSGKTAAFLRGFRAIYLGVFFNVMIMAMVSLAAIKIGGVMLGLSPINCIIWASLITVIFSSMGGFKGVLITDFLLFIIAMVGAVAAAYFALKLPQIGGLSGMLAHFKNPATPELADKLSILPKFDFSTPESRNTLMTLMIIPIAVQWWSVWYPGAEPGGGGYLVQRMLAAKNEKHATGATLFFNIAHYAIRPWPWIIVALCSIIVYPDLASIKAAFPNADPSIIRDDIAYPAMLTFLKPGWIGLVLTSLIAAYMSTISTHLNWGSSYVVNDWYLRFVKPEASQKELVWVGRISTVVLMVLAAGLALLLTDALQSFNILLQIGAGTGLLFILRWFWWRINAISEITAMVVSFLVAVYFQFIHSHILPGLVLEDWQKLVAGVVITTICWIVATLITRPTSDEKLRGFCKLINPGGPGWKKVFAKAEIEGKPIKPDAPAENLPLGILCMFIGCAAVYAALFATGYWLYGEMIPAVISTVITIISAILLIVFWGKINKEKV
ncbi:MAG: Na+:solute symporter [Chlamydiae bacterium]|nr:MAG: Na+:solute symporter [Chlamydiota bacterium]